MINTEINRTLYWEQFLPQIRKVEKKFDRVNSVAPENYKGAGSRILTKVGYWFNITQQYAKVLLIIETGDKELNKQIFDKLEKHRYKINARISQGLNWRRMDENGSSRISIELQHVDCYKDDDWPKVNKFFLEYMPKFVSEFDQYLEMVKIDELLRENPKYPDSIKGVRQLEEKMKNLLPKSKKRISLVIERGATAKKIKVINGYKCQICEGIGENPYSFVKAKDGNHYIETHHIEPVSKKSVGSLSFVNLITVCANHHRQLHYGCTEVIENEVNYLKIQIDDAVILINKIDLKNL